MSTHSTPCEVKLVTNPWHFQRRLITSEKGEDYLGQRPRWLNSRVLYTCSSIYRNCGYKSFSPRGFYSFCRRRISWTTGTRFIHALFFRLNRASRFPPRQQILPSEMLLIQVLDPCLVPLEAARADSSSRRTSNKTYFLRLGQIWFCVVGTSQGLSRILSIPSRARKRT